jgi:hypothetical protein
LLYLKEGLVVQVAPLYSSVAAVIGSRPPKANPAVCVPVPAKPCLAVLNFLGLVAQEVPSYSSVAPVLAVPSLPPKAKAAVCVPQPAK